MNYTSTMPTKSIGRALPENWQWVTLGDVAEYINGMAFRPVDWKTTGLPIIRIQNLTSSDAHFNHYQGDFDRKYLVENGDLLISWSASLDAHLWQGGRAILNQHIFKVVENSQLITREYLFYAVREAMDEIRSQVHGATMKHITRPEFLAIKIPLPPLDEQQRIAGRLNEQLAAVESARRSAEMQLQAARQLPSAYLREAFSGITPLAASPIRDRAPRAWQWRKLTAVAKLESGHTPSRNHPEWWGGSIPWIALPDIRALDGTTAYETQEYTNDLGIENSSARILPAGTVCLSRTASVGFVTIMGREMATSQDFVNWICGPDLDPYFLMYLFLASRDYFKSLSSGAVHKTVYMPTAKALEVCIPPVEKQKAIAGLLKERLSRSEDLAARVELQLAEIKRLQGSVLREAFTGQG